MNKWQIFFIKIIAVNPFSNHSDIIWGTVSVSIGINHTTSQQVSDVFRIKVAVDLWWPVLWYVVEIQTVRWTLMTDSSTLGFLFHCITVLLTSDPSKVLGDKESSRLRFSCSRPLLPIILLTSNCNNLSYTFKIKFGKRKTFNF